MEVSDYHLGMVYIGKYCLPEINKVSHYYHGFKIGCGKKIVCLFVQTDVSL